MKLICALILAVLGILPAEGSSPNGSPRTLTLPLHHQNGVEGPVYTVDVQVAAQRFSLTLDTGAQNFVLFSKGYASTLRPLCGKGDMQRKLFDPSLSRTLKLTNEPSGALLRAYPYVGLECHKSVGSEITLYGDTYQIGSVSVPEVPFVLSNRTTHPLNPQWASDGVLPLGLAQYISGGGAIRTVLDALGGKQEVSVFLGNAGGKVTFGGKDMQNCKDNWIKLLSTKVEWTLPVASLNLGSRRIVAREMAQISTATPLLVVPSFNSYFSNLINALDGRFDNDLDLYTVDCPKAGTLPAINITLGLPTGLTYSVSPHDYVAESNTNSGKKCALLIVQGDGGWFIVGTQFHPKRCVNFDYDSEQIGFADPKN